ncbi:hypothetical protein PLESTF_000511900 [Pleodorina starrii]|nr:hypothetical protein PLESTF_000511900 [Pleodorina starrii]
MTAALEVLADAAAATAADDGQGAGAAVAAAFDAVLEVPSPVPLRPGAQVKPRFMTGAEMAAVLRRRAVEREMKEILAGARQYFRDLSPDSKRELKTSEKAAKDKVYGRSSDAGGAGGSAGNDAVGSGSGAAKRNRGRVSGKPGKRGRSAGRQQSAAEAGTGNLAGGPVPRPRRAVQVPLRYRQSADLGRDDCDSESSEQDGTVSET